MSDRERDLLRSLRDLATRVGPALAPVGHLELLRSITDTARALLGAAACSIALLDEDQEHLVFEVASGIGAEEVRGQRVPVDRGIAGWVVTTGQPIAIGDVQSDPRFAQDVAAATGYVPRVILAVPMETEDATIGVIEVLDPSRDAADMGVLSTFARQAALAIVGSRSFADLGRALFEAAARASDDGDLSRALDEVAAESPGDVADASRLAALLNELARMGPAEQRAGAGLLEQLIEYLRERDRGRPA